MNYIVTDNEVLFNFTNSFDAFQNYLDLVIYKLNFLVELVKVNNQLNIPYFIKIKLYITENTYTKYTIFFDLNDFKFKNYHSYNIHTMDWLVEEQNNILNNKIIAIKNIKSTLDNYMANINQNVFMNNTRNTYTYDNGSTSHAPSRT